MKVRSSLDVHQKKEKMQKRLNKELLDDEPSKLSDMMTPIHAREANIMDDDQSNLNYAYELPRLND